jgi:O-antigen/teichoic acid export membrane protein
MKIVYSAAINVASVVAVALAGVGATWVMARYLPVEQFGRVALVLAVVNAVGILEGLRPVVIFHAHSGELPWHGLYRDARRISRLTGAVVFAAAFVGGVVTERFGLSVWESLILAATTMLFFWVALYWAFLDADGDTAFTGAWRGVAWVAAYSAFAALAIVAAPFAAYLVVLLAMNVTLVGIYYVRLSRRRDLRVTSDPGRRVAWLYRQAVENIRLNISAVTIGVSDRLAIGAALGSAQVGLYSAPYEFATKPAALVRGLAQVLYPGAVRLSKEGGSIDAYWVRVSAPIVLLAISGCAIVVCLRDPLIALLLGPNFAGSADVFGILALSFWMVTFGYAANVYLNTYGDFVLQRRFYDWAAAVMLLGLLPAVYLAGIEGVACLYTLVRCVDFALGATIWRRAAVGCSPAWTAAMAGAIALTFVAAWMRTVAGALLGIAACSALLLQFLRRGR